MTGGQRSQQGLNRREFSERLDLALKSEVFVE